MTIQHFTQHTIDTQNKETLFYKIITLCISFYLLGLSKFF